MEKSYFSDIINKFFPKLEKLVELVNDKRKNLTYLHKEMLSNLYSADGKWESASVNNIYVKADYVAMDSPVAPKSRDTVSASNGKLPKLAVKRKLLESEIKMLQILQVQTDGWKRVQQKLANDATFCAVALDEANEAAFLEGLSNGVIVVPDSNAGENAGLRLNFGYLPENSFGATTKGKIYLPDIKKVIEKADVDGNTIIQILIAKSEFDALRQTREAKELVANFEGRVYTDNTTLPTPSASKFNEAFADDNNGITFKVIDRSVKYERNGKKGSYKPWNANRLVFICNEKVGSLVYTETAEQLNQSKQADYTVVDTYKLISKYRTLDPFEEITLGQAIVAPIIEDVDQIYVLDISEAEEVDETAEAEDTEDKSVTVWGTKYDKAKLIAVMKAQGISINANASDATVIAKINGLSDEDEEKLKTAAEEAKA